MRSIGYKLSKCRDLKQNLVLMLIPLLLLVFMIFRLVELNYFYQGWYDPVYAYLMNGLTFASGSFDIGHTDHPGTPLQLFCALLIRLVSLFRDVPTGQIADDVIKNPELYLKVISFTLITLVSISLFFEGKAIYRSTGNVAMALLLQLVPLLSFDLVKFLPIVCCESVIIFSSFSILALLSNYERAERHTVLVAIAFFSALSVATKISSVCIMIIPLVCIKNNRNRLFYLFYTSLFIVLFVLPIASKLGAFFGFMKAIATHSGSYGSGKATLIDWNLYFSSIFDIFTKDFFFTLYLIALIAGWIVIVKKNIKDSLFRLQLAVSLATLFQIVVVARHYSFHYLMPLFSLEMPLQGYLWLMLLKKKIFSIPSKATILIVSLLVLSVFIRLIVKNEFQKGIVTPVEATAQLIKSEMKAPFILLTDGNGGGAFIDPAFQFGVGYSGSTVSPAYAKIVEKYYGGNYRWNPREGFSDWKGRYLPSEIFSKFEKLYFYERNFEGSKPLSQVNSVIEQSGMTGYLRIKEIFRNDQTREIITEAIIDTASVRKQFIPVLSVTTSMELKQSDDNSILSEDDKYHFAGGELLSEKYSHSGAKSLMLTPALPYGLKVTIPLTLGNRIKAKIMQMSSGEKRALIVASSSKEGETFYQTSPQSKITPMDWDKTEMVFTIPATFSREGISIYLWNPTNDTIWLDDFEINLYR